MRRVSRQIKVGNVTYDISKRYTEFRMLHQRNQQNNYPEIDEFYSFLFYPLTANLSLVPKHIIYFKNVGFQFSLHYLIYFQILTLINYILRHKIFIICPICS